MAGKALKGLTIKIGGDTSELLDSLKDVEKKGASLSKELGEINKLLKMDPTNTQLLAQKQKVLAESIETTKSKLDKLKEAEKQVQEQFKRGEVSEEQVRALQREIVKTESKLNSYERATEETADQLNKLADGADGAADALDDVGDAAEDAGDGFTIGKGAISTFIGNGLTSLVDAAKNAIGSILELSEATREYRNEMAKLNTAFETAGLSADDANKTYTDLYGILGDEGAAVEASQQLAKISKDEADLAANTRILTGVMAEYGNSIPTEGLAEGMAATAAMGEVQGVLADALEWQGVNLDDFNAKLGKLSTEEERAQFIQQELTKLYGESADAYLENNSAVIEANKAQADLQATQAELGAAIEPLTNKFTELKTKALQWLIDKGLPALQDGFNWVKDNIPTLVTVIGGLTAAWLAFGGAQKLIDAWNKIVAISQAALNAVMSANPIGLIIIAVTALVAAFVYLWNNCEAFREFWINLWDGIKKAAKAVVDWFRQAWDTVTSWLKDNWKALLLFITNPIAGVFKYLYDNFEGFRNFVDNIVASVKKFFSDLWSGMINGAKNAWTGVKNAFGSVATWFKDIFSKAWTAVKNVFSTGGKIFSGIKEGIASVFKTVVNGIIRGINKIIAVPFNAINKLLNGIRSTNIMGLQPFLGLWKENPLKVPVIPELARGGVLEKGQVGLLEGDGAEAVVPLEKNTKWLERVAEKLSVFLVDDLDGIGLERSLQSRTSTVSPAVLALGGLSSKLDSILTAIEKGQVLTIDGDALVGATANSMDNALGRRRALAARGAL